MLKKKSENHMVPKTSDKWVAFFSHNYGYFSPTHLFSGIYRGYNA